MNPKRKVGKKSLKYDGSIHEMTELIKKGCKYIPDWKPKQEFNVVYFCNIKDYLNKTGILTFNKKYCREADDKETFTKCVFSCKECNLKFKVTPIVDKQ